MKIYIVIAMLLLAITGLGKYTMNLNEKLFAKTQEAKVLTTNLDSLQRDANIRIAKITALQRKDRDNLLIIDSLKQKAIKDVTRVQNVAKKKAKLYENLVNRDFQQTQKNLEVLTK